MEYNNPRFVYTTYSGNWTIEGKYKILDMEYITNNMLSEDRLKIIKLKEIAWRNKHHFPYGSGDNCPCCFGKKFRACDPNIPGIIAYNCPNPYDNKYRMLDGRHRIMRHLHEGKTESKFYVFDFNEIKNYICDPRPKRKNIVIMPQ
tara:strand:+ start:57 stop:494 length:438 start_codon:yes stop_codon:yes gene_type:complete